MPKSYDVGYRKPPKHTQFRKGQSGNQKGRPKGSKSLLDKLKSMMTETVVVREAGQVRRLSRADAMLLSLWNQATKGDVRATNLLLSLLEQSGLIKPDDLPRDIRIVFVSPDGTESTELQPPLIEHQPALTRRK